MITSYRTRVLVLVGILAIASHARAEVKAHALFADNAVLQQQMNVPVWGTANDGENVAVAYQDQKVATIAENGKWKVVLKPMSAGSPPSTMTITGSSTAKPLEFKNVVVGEVWLISGQSNMAMGVGKVPNAVEIEKKSDDPMLRYFYVPWNSTDAPQTDIKPGDGGAGHWNASNAYYTHMFPAVGYFFGRDLRKLRNVPIGLINSCVGGSYAESWIPRKYLDADPVFFKPALTRWDTYVKAVNVAIEQYKKDEPALMKKWEEDAAKAKAEGKKEPPKPQPPQDPEKDPRLKTAGLYNAMIAPLQPYAIRGAAWYQGENDAGDAYRYRTVLPTMIKSWRDTWNAGDFPFLIVQLPAYGKTPTDPVESAWAEQRESQLIVSQNVPNCGLVVSIDCGDEKIPMNLHPPKKEPIGQRLAILANGMVYGEKAEVSGPVYDAMKIDGDRAIISFKHLGGGLVAKDGELKGFTIAGEDKKFVNATAKIEGDTVVVSSPGVAKPIAVRYAWADFPACNLWNKADLPASPFRTDDFPMTTMTQH